MSEARRSVAAAGTRLNFAGLDGILRTMIAAMVATMMLLLDLISFSQLIYSGPLAQSRTAGFSAMLLAFVVGSLVFATIRRGVPVTHTFIGAAVVVQAAIAASVADRLNAAGITDPDLVTTSILLAIGAATLTTSVIFTLLGALRASLLAQLLPYPVLTGFLGGVGALFIQGGVQIGARMAGPIPDVSALSDPGLLGRLAVTLAIGICAFELPRRLRHWATFPGIIVVAFVLVHASLGWLHVGTSAAQATGWLLDPIPEGSLLRVPALYGIGSFDPALLVSLIPKILTQAVVAVIIQILYILSVELALQRELDIDRTFVASGAANVLASLFGSPAMGVGRSPTVLLHNLGGGNWLGWSLTIAIMAALLVFGASSLALLPRPLAGGALIALGLGLIASLVTTLRTISLWETAIALTVCAATASFGAASGFLVGIALAILIFAVQYARVPAVRLALTGAERPSSVIRPPDVAQALRQASSHTAIYTLQGFLFFLNAQAIYRRVKAEQGLRSLVLDFRDCVGLDSSALLAFRKMAQLALEADFDLLLVGLAPMSEQQVRRNGIAALPRVHLFSTLDHALQWTEGAHLATAGIATGAEVADFGEQIGRTLGCTVAPADLAPYLTVSTLDADEILLRQGDIADSLYFIETGILSVELEIAERANLRLRTTTAGTVIGEVAMLQSGRRTATVIAQTVSRVSRLDRAALARMEHERPDLALLVQRFLIVELAAKLADTTRLLEAETR
jgi:SulP family sulfate permease